LYPKRVLLEWPNGRVQVAYHKELVPFEDLEPDDYLGTADLQQYFGVSARTVYRWMADEGLTPDDKIGRDYYFEKRTVLRWEKQNRPKRGRPW
jgi:hypothetical protein